MGLDIAFCASMQRVADDAHDSGSFRGLSIYIGDPEQCHVERADGIETGCYQADVSSFRAGSYGGYNRWRERLSMLGMGVMPRHVWLNPPAFAGQPFYEIVNFSDCEGVIGPKTSAKLARDFKDHRDRATAAFGEFDLAVYDDFAEAFSTASKGGAVVFQ